MTRQQILDDHPDEEFLFADGFDDYIIGVARQFSRPPLIAYDQAKVIAQLVSQDGMDPDEAWEFFEYNIIGAWVGEQTPVFIEAPPV
jgi:hypothetical protein